MHGYRTSVHNLGIDSGRFTGPRLRSGKSNFVHLSGPYAFVASEDHKPIVRRTIRLRDDGPDKVAGSWRFGFANNHISSIALYIVDRGEQGACRRTPHFAEFNTIYRNKYPLIYLILYVFKWRESEIFRQAPSRQVESYGRNRNIGAICRSSDARQPYFSCRLVGQTHKTGISRTLVL